MKKAMISIALCAALAAGPVSIYAEETTEQEMQDTSIFEELSGLTFDYSSGVGGWFVEMLVDENGGFTGQYRDSEMGAAAEEYPNGTVYGCLFHGKFSVAGKNEDGSYLLKVDEAGIDEGQEDKVIEDGILYLLSDSFGLKEGDSVQLFPEGYKVADLPEDYLFWAHLNLLDEVPETLPFYGLYDEAQDSGFVGTKNDDPGNEESVSGNGETAGEDEETVSGTDETEGYAGMANPWEETDAEGFVQTLGLELNVPEGAENVSCRMLKEDGLGEIGYILNGIDYIARIKASGSWEDISGLLYGNNWEKEEECKVDYCEGITRQVKDETLGIMIKNCMWFDAVPGIMYSLTAEADDVEGVDIAAEAEKVFLPMQGDS